MSILQIVDDAVLKEACEESPLCIIAALPHILDTGADGRNTYIKMMTELADKYKQRHWGYVDHRHYSYTCIFMFASIGGERVGVGSISRGYLRGWGWASVCQPSVFFSQRGETGASFIPCFGLCL